MLTVCCLLIHSCNADGGDEEKQRVQAEDDHDPDLHGEPAEDPVEHQHQTRDEHLEREVHEELREAGSLAVTPALFKAQHGRLRRFQQSHT